MLNEIKSITYYSDFTALIEIENQAIAKSCRVGHFIIARFDEEGVRIPFTIIKSDAEKATIGFIIHRAAGLGDILNRLSVGYVIIDVLGPLGQAMTFEKMNHIACVGDGAGLVPLLPVIKRYCDLGVKVTAILSEQSSHTNCLLPLIEPYAEVIDASQDGAEKILTDMLASNGIDKVVMSGPTLMMKHLSAITAASGVAAEVILNMMMIDGIGLCGICRVTVNGERKLTCIDGPAFDAHAVDYDHLINRQRHFM